MKKSFIAVSLASIISACGLAPIVEGSSAGGCKINLKQLYSAANGGIPESNECNFLEMTDGTILFFNPSVRNDLRSVMANPKELFKANFLIFSPSARTSKMAALTVRKSDNTLLFDAYRAKDSEIDRTMLSPAWSTVFVFCKTLYTNTDSRNVRVGNDPNGVSYSGVTKLPNAQFLITGGLGGGQYDVKASLAIPLTATVYDSNSNKVVKSFKLCQSRSHHLSLLLPDGKVLLVGGMESTSVEIVDPEAGTSRLLACPLRGRNFAATACLDNRGNCLVLGGLDFELRSSGLVERIDIHSETIDKIGDLDIPRSYISSLKAIKNVRLNAIALSDNSILISGGVIKEPNWEYKSFCQDAEITTMDK